MDELHGPEADDSPRTYLSIGEVLDLLKDEFPDVTISKIRFLESQGLLDPERTPSGYRKFHQPDVDRLRWILQQQREKYLPLKVIRERLEAAEADGLLPRSGAAAVAATTSVTTVRPSRSSNVRRPGSLAGSAAAGRDDAALVEQDDHDDQDEHDGDVAAPGSQIGAPPAALGEARHPASLAARAASRRATPAHPASRPRAAVHTGEPTLRPASTDDAANERGRRPSAAPAPVPAPADPSPPAVSAPAASATFGSSNPLLGEATGASLTLDELAGASGLSVEDIRQLETFGLVVGRQVFAATYYDEDALVAARAAAAFRAFGVEPRHLRMYKNAADREAGLFAQIVTPVLRKGRADGRAQAAETLGELLRLGEQLRLVALRQVLRSSVDSR